MLGPILLRSLRLRVSRTLTALAAIAVGAAAVCATLTLYLDVHSKLHSEFRNYGANILVRARAGESLPESALRNVDAALGASGSAAPFAYGVGKGPDGETIVVAGTDFSRVRKLNSYWAVTNWPERPGDALIGARVARSINASANDFQVSYGGRVIRLHSVGTLSTGSDEDTRVYISIEDFTGWTGLAATAIEAFAPGSPPQVNDATSRIAAALPQADVRPIRQIVEAEGNVFQKTRSTLLAAVLIIALTSIICLLATLTASVLERRRDFALMKALGATQNTALALFAGEAAILGTVGGMIGCGLGIALAKWIGWQTFQASVNLRLLVLPAVVVGAIVVTLAAALTPLGLLRRLQPASVLKGE
jgi:putative ABC transport system permease protein